MNVIVDRSTTAVEDRDRLKAYWNRRYVEFSLFESGNPKLSPQQNELYYRCKENAYRRALKAGGVNFRSRPTMLDAACGQGFFTAVARRILPGVQLTGVDISESAVGFLRERFPTHQWECRDLCDPDFSLERQFRVVQSIDFPYLVVSDSIQRRAMVNLARHVEPGGTLILTDTLPRQRLQAHAHIVYRPLRYYRQVFAGMGLQVEAVVPMYYCVPELGQRWSRAGEAWRRLPPEVLFAIDRIGVSLGLPAYHTTPDSGMKMVVFRRKSAA